MPELIAEILRRSSSVCLSLIPLMEEDRVNTDENAYTAVQGQPTDLAWMSALITIEVQMIMLHYRRLQHMREDPEEYNGEDN
jgi:hypothetical protein